MLNFERACSANDLEPGEMRACVVNGVRVAIYNVDGVFYATNDTCTHAHASLSEGFLDGPLVECPMHQGTFDVRTGQPTAPPCTVALRTYEVQVQEAEIFLRPSQPSG
jgi:nitrite reductase/ring-hydroxylating ferredoxin subunit